MDRKTVKVEVWDDWMFEMDGSTKAQALKYIEKLPDGIVFNINWHGYDGADGFLTISRLETDEEYSERMARELQKVRDAKEKADKRAAKKAADRKARIENLQKELKSLMEMK